MQAPEKGQFQAGVPLAQAAGVNVAAYNPVTSALGNAANAVNNATTLARELQQEQERQFMAEAELKMTKASADLQLELVGKANPQDHVDLAREKFDSLKADMLTNGRYSPRFERLMSQRLDLFTNQKLEKITLDARLAQVENGKRLQLQLVQRDIDSGDFEGATQRLTGMAGTYIPDEEVESGVMKIERAKANQTLQIDKSRDPAGTLERLKDEANYSHLNPIARLNEMDDAKAEIQKRAATAKDSFDDDLATGAIGTPEEVEKKYGPEGANLRPAVVEIMKGILADRKDAAKKLEHSTPAYQNETKGRISKMLKSYSIDEDGFDEKLVEMMALVDTLPSDATKDELTRQIGLVRNGQAKQKETAVDMARATIDDFYEAGGYGQVTKEQAVGAAIDAGFLKDREKLALTGFSTETLEYITGKNAKGEFTTDGAKLTDTERRKRFLEKYPQRTNKQKALDPFTQSAFEAIQKGESKISWTDKDAEAAALRAYGADKTALEDWARLSPEDAKDPKKLAQKTYELTSSSRYKGAVNLIVTPPPPRRASAAVDMPSGGVSPWDPDTSILPPAPFNP